MTVAKLCSRVTSGGTPSRANPGFYEPGEYRWVKSKELLDRSLVDTEEFISEAGLRGSSAKPIRPNSVLMAMYGANVGQLGWLRVQATVNQAVCAMETDPDVTDGRWLFYSLMHWRPALTAKAHGAAQQNLNQGLIREFAIPSPPLDVQRKIAAVLGAYDELIENNLRRIEILEEMAQAVYREWFVNFRFPGHEDVDPVDSPLGAIPEGWIVATLGEQSTVVMGQSPKSEFYNESGVGLPFHQGVSNFGRHFPSHVKYCTVESRVAEIGDTLVSVRAPVGRVNTADTKLIIGRGLSAIRPSCGAAGFHYRQLREVFKEEDTMGGGTIYKAITKGDLLLIPWIVVDRALQDSFDSVERPMFRLISNLTRQNENLRTTRDLLLPKLVSGEIDVSDLDIDTERLVA